MLPPPTSEPRLQFRVWAPTTPVIAQPAKAGDSDQLRSPPGGSGSETWTLVAVPVPAAPELDTVMSKPIAVPAETGPVGLAVFVMWIAGHWTVTVAVEV